VAHRLHQVDELALVSCQLDVTGSEWATEESDRADTLAENGAEPDTRRITVDDEKLVEVRHL
jgi:hypothetical protein